MKAVSYWVAFEEAEPFASPEEGIVIVTFASGLLRSGSDQRDTVHCRWYG
jgi:hypothetical protein